VVDYLEQALAGLFEVGSELGVFGTEMHEFLQFLADFVLDAWGAFAGLFVEDRWVKAKIQCS
jgi:hypothetical protein